MRKTIGSVAVALVVAVAGPAASAGETVTYTGTGTYSVTRALLPLANGGAALHLANDTVATIQPSESGFMNGDCAGLGYLSPDGEATMLAICTFDLTRADGFVVRLDGDPKAGSGVQVLGGRGKFENATGTGTLRRTFVEGDRGSYEYEFKITTP
jgi:hypothetical protein